MRGIDARSALVVHGLELDRIVAAAGTPERRAAAVALRTFVSELVIALDAREAEIAGALGALGEIIGRAPPTLSEAITMAAAVLGSAQERAELAEDAHANCGEQHERMSGMLTTVERDAARQRRRVGELEQEMLDAIRTNARARSS